MATRGSYIHNSMVKFSGASRKCYFYAVFSKFWWFQTKWSTGLLELTKLYKQNPLRGIFIFTIYQNYILALNKTKKKKKSISKFEGVQNEYSKAVSAPNIKSNLCLNNQNNALWQIMHQTTFIRWHQRVVNFFRWFFFSIFMGEKRSRLGTQWCTKGMLSQKYDVNFSQKLDNKGYFQAWNIPSKCRKKLLQIHVLLNYGYNMLSL